jgi:N-ethylmaleimide reductase
MAMTQIFNPTALGGVEIKNRLVMAPMTRSRAQADGTPGDLAAEYYAQRAGVGLIIAESTQPSDNGPGYLMTPGIYTDSHVDGWRKVTDAVHGRGGRIFVQLMHANAPMTSNDRVPQRGVAFDIHRVFRAWPEGISACHCW